MIATTLIPTVVEPITENGLPELVWARKVRAAWQKSVESIIETGRLLIEAKAALPHGGFEIMVKDLPFGARAAQFLMKVASHPVLSNPKHASLLPASWMTLA
jgi:hypothetical protein